MPRSYLQLTVAAFAALVIAFAVRSGVTTSRARGLVDDWMNCIECVDGELQRVLSYGTPVVPILSQYVQSGPPASELLAVRDGETARYQLLRASGADTSKLRDLSDFFASNLDARYRVRSGIALRYVGGSTALQALNATLAQTLRPDVRAHLTLLRDSTPP